jgi:hypothetical protein
MPEDTDLNSEANKGTDDEELDVTDDPVAKAIEAGLQLEREKGRKEAQEEFQRALSEARDSQYREQKARDLTQSFGSTIREVRENLKKLKFYNESGEETTFSDTDLEEKVVKPLSRYNTVGQQAQWTETMLGLRDAALETLPDDKSREEFIRKAGGKSLGEWLEVYADSIAPKSPWAKAKEAEMEAALKAAEARGFEKGKKTPAPPPKGADGTSPPVKTPVDLTTRSGLTKALASKQITEEEFRKKWSTF